MPSRKVLEVKGPTGPDVEAEMLAGALVGGHFSLFNPVFDRVVPEALHQADPVHGEVFELPGDAFDAG